MRRHMLLSSLCYVTHMLLESHWDNSIVVEPASSIFIPHLYMCHNIWINISLAAGKYSPD